MFETKITPRVSETDGVGHINNTFIPTWLEAGRHELFKIFTPDLSFENWRMVIVNTNVDYINQIYFGQDVAVKTWIKKIGNTSIVLYEEIHQAGQVCVKATATYVNFNLKTQKPEPIPEDIRIQLKQHMLPESM
ncbi:acyl-CoA thioester hydrolase [Caldalkalibacillus uzonensis]|uniref:Acyl-CoA thioester hydrolase n=1 Tax=Caldalkalibacillus uzonensis TaxID=353224 RepID=A0ABU0CUL8_9BACI|nr:thioesterase family protein [Caldalkalibacillus uzonensis]MDQ0339798.1 acyl-CoA thioester hydrolase [Caldalkalibacillus uzonensis]